MRYTTRNWRAIDSATRQRSPFDAGWGLASDFVTPAQRTAWNSNAFAGAGIASYRYTLLEIGDHGIQFHKPIGFTKPTFVTDTGNLRATVGQNQAEVHTMINPANAAGYTMPTAWTAENDESNYYAQIRFPREHEVTVNARIRFPADFATWGAQIVWSTLFEFVYERHSGEVTSYQALGVRRDRDSGHPSFGQANFHVYSQGNVNYHSTTLGQYIGEESVDTGYRIYANTWYDCKIVLRTNQFGGGDCEWWINNTKVYDRTGVVGVGHWDLTNNVDFTRPFIAIGYYTDNFKNSIDAPYQNAAYHHAQTGWGQTARDVYVEYESIYLDHTDGAVPFVHPTIPCYSPAPAGFALRYAGVAGSLDSAWNTRAFGLGAATSAQIYGHIDFQSASNPLGLPETGVLNYTASEDHRVWWDFDCSGGQPKLRLQRGATTTVFAPSGAIVPGDPITLEYESGDYTNFFGSTATLYPVY